jgi:hypothetical protein
MKKYLLVVILFAGVHNAFSQDLKSISLYVNLQQFDKAKTEVDGFLANEKNAAKPDGWYYKAYIYNSLGRAVNKPVAESKGLYQSAFEAIKKYTALDPKVPLTTEEKNSTVFNIYYGYYDLGIKTYTDKNFEESFDCFKRSLEVHDYIFSKNLIGPKDLKFTAHDTDVVWNLAIIANTLNKKDEAFIYYKKIADAGLSDEKYASGYDEIVLRYKREKNAELFAKYLAQAKKNYPVDLPYWETKEMEFALAGLENEALLARYEELTKALPNNYILFYNYAVDIDKYITSEAAKGKDINAYKTKIEELFKKAVSLKSTVEGNLQLANLYYGKTFDIQDRAARIKGTKPAEVKVKNELLASVKATMNQAIPYAEEAARLFSEFKEYKYADKANYKLVLEILSGAYKMNGNTAKYTEVEKKRAAAEKL